MTTIVTRVGKGSPLTWTEVDSNFTNLNNAKYESGNNVTFGTIGGTTITASSGFSGALNGTVGATTPASGSFTSITDSGNLTFTGTGNRITGDFSNATVASRVNFQTSTSNSGTYVSTLPSGTGNISGFFAYNAADGDNASLLGLYLTSTVAIINSSKNGTGTNLPMTFYTGGSERMRIDTSGNVGIGLNNPSQKLDVYGSAQLTFAGGNNYLYFQSTDNYVGRNGTSGDIWLNTTAGQNTIFGIGAAEKMRIDSSGNVLVGTTAANARLYGYNNSNSVIGRIENGLTSGTTNDLFQVVSQQAAGTGYYLIRAYAAGTTVEFAVRGDGTVYAQNTTIQSLSDARTKENVRTSNEGLDVIGALRPVRFDFKEGFGNNRKNQLGFIAQEVEQVFPDAVDDTGEESPDGDNYKSVGPSALIPVLVKAIQELKAELDTVKAELNTLKGN